MYCWFHLINIFVFGIVLQKKTFDRRQWWLAEWLSLHVAISGWTNRWLIRLSPGTAVCADLPQNSRLCLAESSKLWKTSQHSPEWNRGPEFNEPQLTGFTSPQLERMGAIWTTLQTTWSRIRATEWRGLSIPGGSTCQGQRLINTISSCR